MPSQNLITARANIDALIASLTATPKPSYSIDGKSVSWTEYLSMLIQQRMEIERQILVSEGPFEIRTQGL